MRAMGKKPAQAGNRRSGGGGGGDSDGGGRRQARLTIPQVLWVVTTTLGVAPKDAMHAFGINQSTGYEYLHRMQKEGWDGVFGKSSGRPRIIDDAAGKLISEEMKKSKDKRGAGVVHRKLNGKIPNCSVRTVRRALKDWGHTYGPVAKEGKQLTAKHKQARVEFCRKWLREPAIARRVLFTDSTVIYSNDVRHSCFCWSHPEDTELRAANDATPQRVFKVHIYGGISVHGHTGLIKVTGTKGLTAFKSTGKALKGVGAEEYQQRVLEGDHGLLESGRGIFAYADNGKHANSWIFQQDGARPHTVCETSEAGKKTRKLIGKYSEGAWIGDGWPACSPDLSLIENVWAQMGEELCKMKEKLPGGDWTSQQQFEKSVSEAWSIVTNDKEYVRKLFSGFHRRLKRCVALKGERVK